MSEAIEITPKDIAKAINDLLEENERLQQENKQLKEERDKLLSHVVGMSYNTEKALELTQKINNNLKEEMK